MLNKEVCKKCIKKNLDYNERWNSVDYAEGNKLYDDDLWDMGYVYCVMSGVDDETDVIVGEGPLGLVKITTFPANCPYKVEHMMLENDDVK